MLLFHHQTLSDIHQGSANDIVFASSLFPLSVVQLLLICKDKGSGRREGKGEEGREGGGGKGRGRREGKGEEGREGGGGKGRGRREGKGEEGREGGGGKGRGRREGKGEEGREGGGGKGKGEERRGRREGGGGKGSGRREGKGEEGREGGGGTEGGGGMKMNVSNLHERKLKKQRLQTTLDPMKKRHI